MSMSRNTIHKRPKFRRPTYTNATVANPPRHARLMFLRSSCGHVLGLAVVSKRQRVIQWAVCR